MATLDPVVGPGKIASMFRRLIGGAVRSSFEELVSPLFLEIRGQLKRLEEGQAELRADLSSLETHVDDMGHRLDLRIDGMGERLDRRIDSLGERLDLRIDGLGDRLAELSTQQGRIVEEVAGLKGEVAGMKVEVAGLKRDRESGDDLVHRVTRIEDRLFARAS